MYLDFIPGWENGGECIPRKDLERAISCCKLASSLLPISSRQFFRKMLISIKKAETSSAAYKNGIVHILARNCCSVPQGLCQEGKFRLADSMRCLLTTGMQPRPASFSLGQFRSEAYMSPNPDQKPKEVLCEEDWEAEATVPLSQNLAKRPFLLFFELWVLDYINDTGEHEGTDCTNYNHLGNPEV